jgi:hypothetical protein
MGLGLEQASLGVDVRREGDAIVLAHVRVADEAS